MTRHVCPGLHPEPLGCYLSGLGLVRLLGEQADPAATARWSSRGLEVETEVGDLASWLADEYVPTPVLSPWNAGSGFGKKDKEPKRRIEALAAHPEPRLRRLQGAIEAARQVMADARARGWIAPDGKGGEKITSKAAIVQEFRNRCPDDLLPWIDATVVLADGETFFPPILGTGGNDGRLDFSTNFHQQLLDILDPAPGARARSVALARDLLGGTQAERLDKAPIGQFDPAAAGGQASSPFGAADPLVNPWEYILLIEGALLFASGAARRNQHAAGRAAIPFTVYSSPDGSPSGASGEQSRGELWVPVWDQPCTLPEIRQLFGEARASWNGRPAQRAVDFYAATRTLGVARGIGEFVRYGLQQRNGLAFVAVPVDRIQVREQTEVRLAARIEDWVRQVRSSDATSAVGTARRRFEAAHLAYARDPAARTLVGMLAALTDLEQAVGRSGQARARTRVRTAPAAGDFLPVLTADGDTPELRVAAGIASCATLWGPDKPSRTMRQILLPVDPPDPKSRSARWRDRPVVMGFGLRPLRDVLADVLAWRSRTAADEPQPEAGRDKAQFRGAPTFRRGIPVPPADLHAFARGELDEAELDLMLRACLALDWSGVRDPCAAGTTTRRVAPVPTLGLLHVLAAGLAPDDAATGTPRLALEPDWASRLAAGQVRAVHQEAAARLLQAGWLAVPSPPAGPQNAFAGTAIAAALVARCRSPRWAMENWGLAMKVRAELDSDKAVHVSGDVHVAELSDSQPTERAEELS